jgi:multiple sugar transport system permease protein
MIRTTVQWRGAPLWRRREMAKSMLAIAPVLVLLALFMVYPITLLFTRSFTEWTGGDDARFVGFANYVRIAHAKETWLYIRNNFFVLLSVPLKVVVALVVTLLLYEQVLGWKFFRGAFFFPFVFSPLIVGYLFRVVFGYRGPLNAILKAIGLGSLAIEWLAQGPTAMMVVVTCIVWGSFGTGVIIFLAAMSSIEPSIFESSILDGANYFQRLFRIVIPSLAGTIQFFSVTSVIFSFTDIFGLIFSLTSGGPGFETTTIDYMVYLQAFMGNAMGYASAIAVILFLILAVLTQVQQRIARRSD